MRDDWNATSLCHTMWHFNASQMHVKKDHSFDLKFWYVIYLILILNLPNLMVIYKTKFIVSISKQKKICHNKWAIFWASRFKYELLNIIENKKNTNNIVV